MNRSRFLAALGAAVAAVALPPTPALLPKPRWTVRRRFGTVVVDARYLRRPRTLLVSPEDYPLAQELLRGARE